MSFSMVENFKQRLYRYNRKCVSSTHQNPPSWFDGSYVSHCIIYE
eukprot:UN21414